MNGSHLRTRGLWKRAPRPNQCSCPFGCVRISRPARLRRGVEPPRGLRRLLGHGVSASPVEDVSISQHSLAVLVRESSCCDVWKRHEGQVGPYRGAQRQQGPCPWIRTTLVQLLRPTRRPVRLTSPLPHGFAASITASRTSSILSGDATVPVSNGAAFGSSSSSLVPSIMACSRRSASSSDSLG